MLSKSLDKERVSWLVLSAQTTTKDYIRAGNKRKSISYFFRTKAVKPQNYSKSTKLVSTKKKNEMYKHETHIFEEIVDQILS